MLVSEFLTDLKARGQLQAAQTVLSDADLVRFANRQMLMVIVPKILSVRQNYFTCYKDYTISGRRYRLPKRCIGGRISGIQIMSGDQSYSLQQLPNTTKSNSAMQGYYMSQGQFILVGTLPSGTMRVTYPCRPPEMTASAVSTKTVTAVGSTSITLSAVHAAGADHYVLRPNAPYRPVSPNVLTNGTSAATDTDCTDYTRYAVGDVLLPDGDSPLSPYVHLQQQLCDWLLQRTLMRVLESLGHVDQLQVAGQKLADIEQDCLALITPRVSDSPKTIFGGQTTGWNWRQ